jgi:hypothetical protein
MTSPYPREGTRLATELAAVARRSFSFFRAKLGTIPTACHFLFIGIPDMPVQGSHVLMVG